MTFQVYKSNFYVRGAPNKGIEMNKDKRKIRAKKKAKQAAISKQGQAHSPNDVNDLGVLSSNKMTIGVMDSNSNIIRTIYTVGMTEFLNVVEKYQEEGFIDLYENKNTPIDGYDVLFEPK